MDLAKQKGFANGVFSSASVAQDVADSAVQANARQIGNWLRSGGTSTKSFTGKFGPNGSSLGTSFKSDGSSSAAGNDYVMQLTRAKGYPGGYFISTLFPK